MLVRRGLPVYVVGVHGEGDAGPVPGTARLSRGVGRDRLGARGAERLFRAVLLGRVSGAPGPGSPGLARLRPGLATREVAFLLIVAAGAWAATIVLAQSMAGMTGTMGLGLAAFAAIWTLMMAAMMLPSVTPT